MIEEKRYSLAEIFAAADVVCEGAIARAAKEPMSECPYPDGTNARTAWLYGWWRANALVAIDVDEEARACFEDAA